MSTSPEATVLSTEACPSWCDGLHELTDDPASPVHEAPKTTVVDPAWSRLEMCGTKRYASWTVGIEGGTFHDGTRYEAVIMCDDGDFQQMEPETARALGTALINAANAMVQI